MLRNPKQMWCGQRFEIVAAVSILHAGVAESTSYRIETSWLGNGLRVVAVEMPRAEYVSIGLLVQDGSLRVPDERQHVPHLVEHLCFREISANPSIDCHFRRHGGSSYAWTEDFQVGYQFDAPAAIGSFILEEIRHQWDEPFADTRVKLEAERIRHEMRALGGNTALTNLAWRHANSGPLRRTYSAHLRGIDSLAAADLWQHFTKTYVGNRMTLILAASPQVLQNLQPAVVRMADIPRGTPAQPANFGDLSWLSGSLKDDADLRAFFGLHFPMSATPAVSARLSMRSAVATYLRDRLALAMPVTYDVGFTVEASEDAEIWIFRPFTDFRVDSLAAVTAAAESAFHWLTADSAGAWWQSSANEIQHQFGASAGDPTVVAENVLCVAKMMAQDEALPNVFPWTVAPPESLHAAYRRTLESAVFFRTVDAGSVGPVDDESEDPVLVQVAWAVANWHEEHTMASWIALGLSLTMVVLVAWQPPRLTRSAASLRLAPTRRQRAV